MGMLYDAKTDLTGMRFGKWTVLSKAPNKNSRVYWNCICDCGVQKEVQGRSLRDQTSKSCGGCDPNKIQRISQLNFKDETGNRYGRLVVLERASENQHKHAAWICKCDCGNMVTVNGEYLRSGGTKSCGCLREEFDSYGVQYITKLLSDNNINFVKEKTFESFISEENGAPYRFDFYIPKENYIIEFDGIQHFKCVGWGDRKQIAQSFQRTQLNDKIKNAWCFQNNIPIIRIPYTHEHDIVLEDIKIETSKFLLKEEKILYEYSNS